MGEVLPPLFGCMIHTVEKVAVHQGARLGHAITQTRGTAHIRDCCGHVCTRCVCVGENTFAVDAYAYGLCTQQVQTSTRLVYLVPWQHGKLPLLALHQIGSAREGKREQDEACDAIESRCDAV